MVSDLSISYSKMSDFVSFQLLGLTLVAKLRNFGFEGNSNALIFFDTKNHVRFDNVLSSSV